ncbi:MAG: hypothetical protein LCH37_12850 [Bacteroidetes bacterium]|nr:hypothetical protein [Bacteroidota bacterium]
MEIDFVFFGVEIEYAGCALEQATAGSSVQVHISPAKADGDYKRMARPAGDNKFSKVNARI